MRIILSLMNSCLFTMQNQTFWLFTSFWSKVSKEIKSNTMLWMPQLSNHFKSFKARMDTCINHDPMKTNQYMLLNFIISKMVQSTYGIIYFLYSWKHNTFFSPPLEMARLLNYKPTMTRQGLGFGQASQTITSTYIKTTCLSHIFFMALPFFHSDLCNHLHLVACTLTLPYTLVLQGANLTFQVIDWMCLHSNLHIWLFKSAVAVVCLHCNLHVAFQVSCHCGVLWLMCSVEAMHAPSIETPSNAIPISNAYICTSFPNHSWNYIIKYDMCFSVHVTHSLLTKIIIYHHCSNPHT